MAANLAYFSLSLSLFRKGGKLPPTHTLSPKTGHVVGPFLPPHLSQGSRRGERRRRNCSFLLPLCHRIVCTTTASCVSRSSAGEISRQRERHLIARTPCKVHRGGEKIVWKLWSPPPLSLPSKTLWLRVVKLAFCQPRHDSLNVLPPPPPRPLLPLFPSILGPAPATHPQVEMTLQVKSVRTLIS